MTTQDLLDQLTKRFKNQREEFTSEFSHYAYAIIKLCKDYREECKELTSKAQDLYEAGNPDISSELVDQLSSDEDWADEIIDHLDELGDPTPEFNH